MKKGLIYCRVSTEEQAKQGQSIQAQHKICSNYAKENKIKIVQVFKDEGKSATNINRPALQSLLELVSEDDTIDCVLIQDTDRLARNTLDHLSIKSIFKKNKVDLISISQPLLDSSPEGNFIDTVLAATNALQSQITGRKTSKVMEEKIKAGWWANKAPFGYMNATNPKSTSNLDKKIIIPDPEKAPQIRQIFKDYSTGKFTIKSITDKYQKMGLTTNGGTVVYSSQMHKLLAHPIYYGKIPWKGKLYQGKHEPLVTKEMWHDVQRIMDNHNQHASRTRKHNYLLRGYVYCDTCDSRFWASPHKGNTTTIEYYFCSSCKKGTYTEVKDLERQVIKWFGKVKMSDEYSQELINTAMEVLSDIRSSRDTEKTTLRNQQTALESKLQTAEDKLLSGTLSDDRYKVISDKIISQLESIEEALGTNNHTYQNKFEKIKELALMARNIKQTYKDADPDLKRRYIDLFFDKFIVNDGKIILALPSEHVKPLMKEGKITVRVRNNWLPDEDSNLGP